MSLTLAHPLVLPLFGPTPLLDFGPRELFILPGAAYLYILATRRNTRKRRALLVGFVHYATLLFWLDIAMNEFGGMPRYQSLSVLALLAGYLALFTMGLPPLAAWLAARVSVPRPLCFAAAVISLEWARTHALTGFPWGLWGYSQARNLPLANLAAWGGVYLVSACIAVAAAWTVDAARKRASWTLLLLFLIGIHLLGALRLWNDTEQGKSLSVALLQGNIKQELKNQGVASGPQIARVYKKLLDQAGDVDLAVWPESAWPYSLSLDSEFFTIDRDIGMVVGLVRRGRVEDSRVAYNSSVYVSAGGRIEGGQHKLHLVPFGEYVPLRWLLPVEKFVPGMSDFSPGQRAAPVGPERVGVEICYDGIFPSINRAHVTAGAELLANLT
ncbi:MAG: apolipoprotein N-acyltransferase, partial [Myxococcota bacterium]